VQRSVFAGLGVDVGFRVNIGSGFVYAPSLDDVNFEQSTTNDVQVCTVAAGPQACDSNQVEACRRCSDNVFGGTSTTDLQVNENRKVTLNSVRDFQDVDVLGHGQLYLATSGIYTFRSLHFWQDTELILGDDGPYTLAVNEDVEIDERFKITHGKSTRLTIIQYTPSGHFFLSNAPSSRHHELRFNLIAQADHSQGGYVHIGHRQRIRGFISTLADVYLMANVTIYDSKCA